jgi:hypothetical protein
VTSVDRSPERELVAAANRHLHAFGGRDKINTSQVATYLRWLGGDPMSHPTLASFSRAKLDWREVAGRPGLRREEPMLASIDREFVRWTTERRAAGDQFPKAHVWIRGFVATALAVEERRGNQRHAEPRSEGSGPALAGLRSRYRARALRRRRRST